MPIYNYRCQKCNHEFEALLKTYNEAVQCPECGSAELKKLPGRISIGSSGAKCDHHGSCPAEGTHRCGCGCCHKHER